MELSKEVQSFSSACERLIDTIARQTVLLLFGPFNASLISLHIRVTAEAATGWAEVRLPRRTAPGA